MSSQGLSTLDSVMAQLSTFCSDHDSGHNRKDVWTSQWNTFLGSITELKVSILPPTGIHLFFYKIINSLRSFLLSFFLYTIGCFTLKNNFSPLIYTKPILFIQVMVIQIYVKMIGLVIHKTELLLLII